MDIKPELENPRARWITLAVTCLAGILASIQSSSLIVALVQLVTALEATFASIIWVLLSFMLAVGATAPILGFFSDSGLKGVRCKLFNFGFTIFGIGSLLAGFAQPKFKAVDLILYRALMGVGAGFIFSNSSPILADKFHPYGQMGLAQGLWGVGFAMGSVVGPVVGGLLLEAGWSWIFWFNVPFCAIGCTIGFWQVKDYVPKEIVGAGGEKKPQITFVQVMRKFDYLGALLLLTAICTMFVAVVSSIFPTPTLGATATIAFGVVCGACAAIFLAWDIYRRDHTPFVNFRLFLNRTFTLCVVGSMCNALARGGLTFAFIFLFQGPFGATALEAGIKVIPFGIGFLLGGFPSGKLGDMYGFKIPSAIGPLVSCFGIMGAAFIHVDTNYWVIAAYLFFAGLGGGIYNSPTTALMMLSIKPTERGQSSGLSMMMSMVANAFSIVICFDLIVGSLDQALVYKLFIVGGGGLDDATLAPFLNGFHAVIWIIVAMNVCASFLSTQIKEQKRPKKGPATTTTTTPPPSAGTPLAELVKAESDPADPDAGQPEPLTAPLEGRDANPTEDEQIREKMEKELASDVAPSDHHQSHHQEVELHAIKVDGSEPAHSSVAPVAIEIQAEPNARSNPEPAQAPSESTTISSPSEADRPKESSEIVSNSPQTNSQ